MLRYPTLTVACEPEPTTRASQMGSWPGSEKASEEAGLCMGLGGGT